MQFKLIYFLRLTVMLFAGRGLVKKVLVPFLLGLKFKTTVLLPLAFALIALKAWKALTLGLISLVVSTAVVVFKLAKPKVRGNRPGELSLWQPNKSFCFFVFRLLTTKWFTIHTIITTLPIW